MSSTSSSTNSGASQQTTQNINSIAICVSFEKRTLTTEQLFCQIQHLKQRTTKEQATKRAEGQQNGH
ncbi:hypothetical protein niasHT_027439 [Heterodera trifolii]|uniref:Uncharacterized protein n=1 Tax=Heterodera trifolii TaxID=157864 RepID=A0ABD2JS17_9BILA